MLKRMANVIVGVSLKMFTEGKDYNLAIIKRENSLISTKVKK